jgi:hypothetical protein
MRAVTLSKTKKKQKNNQELQIVSVYSSLRQQRVFDLHRHAEECAGFFKDFQLGGITE